MHTVKAIIFDCFGVIVTDTFVAFREAQFGDDPGKMQQAIDAAHAVDLGMISKPEFLQIIADMSGMAVKDVFEMLENGSVLDRRLLDTIKTLRPTYKVGMLSNISPHRLEDFLSADDKALFDGLSLSYATGFVKPDLRAYQAAAEQLGVSSGECVFIDDQERNVTAAREVGMHGIHYKNFAQFERELKKLLQ